MNVGGREGVNEPSAGDKWTLRDGRVGETGAGVNQRVMQINKNTQVGPLPGRTQRKEQRSRGDLTPTDKPDLTTVIPEAPARYLKYQKIPDSSQ